MPLKQQSVLQISDQSHSHVHLTYTSSIFHNKMLRGAASKKLISWAIKESKEFFFPFSLAVVLMLFNGVLYSWSVFSP